VLVITSVVFIWRIVDTSVIIGLLLLIVVAQVQYTYGTRDSMMVTKLIMTTIALGSPEFVQFGLISYMTDNIFESE